MLKNSKTFRKGSAFEEIVEQHFILKGYQPYSANQGGKHLIDWFMVNKETGVQIWVDAKAYTPMNDGGYLVTGINLTHYHDYQRLNRQSKNALWIVFGDHEERMAYGETFDNLEPYIFPDDRNGYAVLKPSPYLLKGNTGMKVMWHRSRFRDLFPLSDEQCAILASLSKEKPCFQPSLIDE
jgi:hypothetical protein